MPLTSVLPHSRSPWQVARTRAPDLTGFAGRSGFCVVDLHPPPSGPGEPVGG